MQQETNNLETQGVQSSEKSYKKILWVTVIVFFLILMIKATFFTPVGGGLPGATLQMTQGQKIATVILGFAALCDVVTFVVVIIMIVRNKFKK